MIVLSRRPGESVHIVRANESCLITALSLRGGDSTVLVSYTNAASPGALGTTATPSPDAAT